MPSGAGNSFGDSVTVFNVVGPVDEPEAGKGIMGDEPLRSRNGVASRLSRLGQQATAIPGLALAGRGWRFLTTAARDLVFPPRCLICDADILTESEPPMFCPNCVGRLTPDLWLGCRRCGSEVAQQTQGADQCAACKNAPLCFDAVVPLGRYEAELRDLVLRMKRPAHEGLSAAVGSLFARRRHRELTDLRPDMIVPIPMYWARRLVRGVNSPEVLSRNIGKLLRVPVQRVLIRRRNTKPQKDLRPKERFRNMENAFRVRPNVDLRGARILLIDDILTTGATCSEAAKMLKEAGAAGVAVGVIARAHGDQRRRKRSVMT